MAPRRTHLLGQPDDLEQDSHLVIRHIIGKTLHDLCLRGRVRRCRRRHSLFRFEKLF